MAMETKSRKENKSIKQLLNKKKEKGVVNKSVVDKTKTINKKQKNDKQKVTKTTSKSSSKFLLFSIRNKIFLCFIIPILFMIIVGTLAYQKSAEGMSQKFQESTAQTINMANEYIEMSGSFIVSEAMKYAYDSNLGRYYLGLISDPLEKMNFLTSKGSEILSSQVSNPFISDIHIITKEDVNMLTTQTSATTKGVFEKYREAMAVDGKRLSKWVDKHDLLDEYLLIDSSDYILACQFMSKSNNACVVVDVKQSAIKEFLDGIQLGEGSVVGFVTQNGREIISETLAEGSESAFAGLETIFFNQEFYQEAINSGELSSVSEIKYNGDDYLFLYSLSEEHGGCVVALVPMKIVTGQAEEIKGLTITLVILACIIAVAIGVIISLGIQGNMKRISRTLDEVAKGDLTVGIKVRSRDEFRSLGNSTSDMIRNNKNLVVKVGMATEQLEASSDQVKQASNVINEYSTDITQAISEINQGMEKQAQHAQECVVKTDQLSAEIQEVTSTAKSVEKLVNETEEMIQRGMGIVRNLGKSAESTTSMTAKVGSSIAELQKESATIDTFVETINSITEQTNLLSLNASIEAARAGESGRGFSVVAEEIRKLADLSAEAANQIRNNVNNIEIQTKNSVDSARQAESMVALQTEAVGEVIEVFSDMNKRMLELIEGLKEIVMSTEQADRDRSETLESVKNISNIIEETATSTEVVREIAMKLLHNVENLDKTADALGENMNELKTEVSVFKTV